MSTTDTLQPTALERSHLVDATDLARNTQTAFVEEDVKEFLKLGIRLDRAARALALGPAADLNRYLKRVQNKLARGGDLSTAQIRACMNILREQVQNLPPTKDYIVDLSVTQEPKRFRCPTDGCDFTCSNRVDWAQHRASEHGFKPGNGTLDQAILDEKPVLAEPEETRISIDHLHDGFYAIPDATSPNETPYRFFRVMRIRRPQHLNRRYVWGRKMTGSEICPAGTITLRELRGETKELIGYQRPDENYRGSRKDVIEKIGESPELWASMYAMIHERCFICAKPLTDDISRADKMGPVCMKKYGAHYFRKAPVSITSTG